MTQIIDSLDEVAAAYDAAFVDLWGCLHDGIRAFPEAVEALEVFRGAGKAVVLVTNAPRSRDEVAEQLDGFGVPRSAWDTIATSGDSARLGLHMGAVGRKVYFIGKPDDLTIFEPLDGVELGPAVEQVPFDVAEGMICTGPEDALADPSVYRPQFLSAKARGLKLLCANPDVVVDRGDRREWCAGALAELYTEMGGESLYFGKPHPPIYDLARRRLSDVADVADDRILCIGDGIHTDISGAQGEGLDAVFITGGLARRETETARAPSEAALSRFLQQHQMSPRFAMGRLR